MRVKQYSHSGWLQNFLSGLLTQFDDLIARRVGKSFEKRFNGITRLQLRRTPLGPGSDDRECLHWPPFYRYPSKGETRCT
jgi:hypothetical protein